MKYPGQGAPMTRKPAPRPSQTAKSATKGATRGRPIKGRRQSGRSNKQVESEDEDEPESEHDQQPADDKKDPKEEDPAKGDSKVEDDVDAKARFPVILTTYEILMRDRPHLAHFHWGYIVVDEGHRLKNFDCKLMQEMKKLKSGSRLILTGTPLHVSSCGASTCIPPSSRLQNNLAELWSLLNFILPDIFHDLDSFQEWFVTMCGSGSLCP
jgi:ATP-dependent DNA helicase